MSDRESCTHHFEHVKQTRPFTEREYMQCTKCGLQNPLGLFQHWDTERDGPAVKWPPRIDFARNSYVYQYEPKIMPKKTWFDHMIDAFTAPFKPKRKRNPYMTIRRLSSYGGTIGVHRVWCVHCTKCEIPGTKKTLIFAKTSTWQEAITAATHHAHNHH